MRPGFSTANAETVKSGRKMRREISTANIESSKSSRKSTTAAVQQTVGDKNQRIRSANA